MYVGIKGWVFWRGCFLIGIWRMRRSLLGGEKGKGIEGREESR